MSGNWSTFEDLRSALAADAAPVKPLRIAPRLVPPAVLAVLVLATVMLSLFGLRTDIAQLGNLWLFVPSVLELAVALMLIGVGLREAIPGLGGHRTMMWMGVAIGGMMQIVTAVLTHWRSPGPHVPAATSLGAVALCLLMELLLALPLLVIGFRILGQGLSTRPVRGGVCIGIGAGLAADSLWRMFCPVADLEHVFRAHLSSVVVAVAIGALVGSVWDHLRLRAWHRSFPGRRS